MLTLIAQFGKGISPATKAFSEGSYDENLAAKNLEALISQAIGIVTILGSLFFIVYFVLAAFSWVTAGGDAGKVQKSRDKMVLGIIGLVILVMSYGIIGVIGRVLGLDLLRPGQTILDTLRP